MKQALEGQTGAQRQGHFKNTQYLYTMFSSSMFHFLISILGFLFSFFLIK